MKYQTEAAARAKMCPMSAALGENAIACLASHCMAWRWFKHDVRRFYIAGAVEVEPPRDQVPASWEWVPYDVTDGCGGHWIEDEASHLARRTGFCGMAGKP